MYYLGIDLGATNVRAAVGDAEARVLGTARRLTPSGPTGEAVTEAVLAVATEACADVGIAPGTVAAAGIGSMGRLDGAGGVRSPANLDGGVGSVRLVDPLAGLLSTETVVLHSDTLAAAIGERFHTHPETEQFAYVTVSSGIGAGVIADGRPLSGWGGNAGEVGHTTIDADGFVDCGCGSAGHWEAYCSGTGIPRFARALHEREPTATSLSLGEESFSAADVFEHAPGDAFAERLLDRVAALNVRGFATVVNAYAPEVLSVGGAVALNNPERILTPLRERLGDEIVVDTPEITLCELGDRAGLKGALVSAIEADGG